MSLGGSGVSIGGVRMLRVGTPVNMFAFGTVLMRLHFLPAGNHSRFKRQVVCTEIIVRGRGQRVRSIVFCVSGQNAGVANHTKGDLSRLVLVY